MVKKLLMCGFVLTFASGPMLGVACAGEAEKGDADDVVVEEEREREVARPDEGRRRRRNPMREGGGRPAHGRRFRPDPGERMERLLNLIREKFPHKYEELMRYKEEDPALFHKKLREYSGHLRDRMRGMGEDPAVMERIKEIRKLDREARELSEQYKQAETDEERNRLAGEIKTKVARAFDLKLVNTEEGVKRMEKKLKQAKDIVEKRRAARDKVVKKRVNYLTGKSKHLEW